LQDLPFSITEVTGVGLAGDDGFKREFTLLNRIPAS